MGFYPFGPVPAFGQMPDVIEGLSGVIPSFSSVPRRSLTGSVASQASGVITLAAVEVPAGQQLTTLGFFSGGTAAVTPAHWWMVLCNLAGVVLGVTADQLTGAISAFTRFNLPMTASVITPGSSGLTELLAGLMVAAATVPTVEGGTPGVTLGPPAVAGVAGAALTTPPAVGSNVGAITGATAMPDLWAF